MYAHPLLLESRLPAGLSSLAVRHHCCASSVSPGEAGRMEGVTLGMVHVGVGVVAAASRTIEAPAGTGLLFPAGTSYRVEHRGCTGHGPCATTVTLLDRMGRQRQPERLPWADPGEPTALAPPALASLLVAILGRPAVAEAPELVAVSLQRGGYGSRGSAGGQQRARLAERAREILATRIAEPLELGELSARLYCTPHHLCRAFRRATGTTLSAELRRLRIGQAMLRLLAGAPDLARLAFDLGFSSHSHFSGDFRRVTGTTPSEFREWSVRTCRMGVGLSHLEQ